jgi:beta-phosphoglucomutase
MTNTYAAIFDMDGVLVDSYRAHYRSWLAMAQEAGLYFTEEDFGRAFGRTSPEIIATYWGNDRFTAEEIAALDQRKEQAYRDLIARDVPAMPGLRPLLDRLAQAGFKLAVGSSGPPENVDLVLDGLAIRPLFGAVVTGADVARGKPDPEVFVKAAQRLGLAPAQCVVIEDSPPGVQAAHAAGMVAVGLTSTGRTPAVLADADLVVGSLPEITPERLRALIDAGR